MRLRKHLHIFITICLNVILTLTNQISATSHNKIIYGADDRVEASEFPIAKFREFSLSVAGKVKNYKLIADNFDPDALSFFKQTFSEDANVCSAERFSGQLKLPI